MWSMKFVNYSLTSGRCNSRLHNPISIVFLDTIAGRGVISANLAPPTGGCIWWGKEQLAQAGADVKEKSVSRA